MDIDPRIKIELERFVGAKIEAVAISSSDGEAVSIAIVTDRVVISVMGEGEVIEGEGSPKQLSMIFTPLLLEIGTLQKMKNKGNGESGKIRIN